MDSAVRPSYKLGPKDRLLVSVFRLVNSITTWYKLPSIIGALNLDDLRIELRQYNLHDGYASGTAQSGPATDPMPDKPFEHVRNSGG